MQKRSLVTNILSIIALVIILGLITTYFYDYTSLFNAHKYTTSLDDNPINFDQNLKDTLHEFQLSNWDNSTIARREELSIQLVDNLATNLGLSRTPTIVFTEVEDKMVAGQFTSYNYTITINTTRLSDSYTLVENIAHEMRHAWQYARALNPKTEQDYVFKENYANYIEYSVDYGKYYGQPLEVDARSYQDQILNLFYNE